MAFDYWKAREAFEEYLEEYDRKDEKIRLKITHTYGVVACVENIGKRMGLMEEDLQLAKIIALLHDIGRFEQVRVFDSFQPDTMDHAAYGAYLLFGNMAEAYCTHPMDDRCLPKGSPMIRCFLEEDSSDSIICQAIALHSDFILPEIKDARALFHARLIRDGDKLDNSRVKIQEPIEAMLGLSWQEAGRGRISPMVWEACVEGRSVLSAHRKTAVDYWASYLAQYYDLNFFQTWEIMKEKNYIKEIAGRLQYEEADTRKKMAQLTKNLERRMEQEIWKNR